MKKLKENSVDDLPAETLGILIHNLDIGTEEGGKIYYDYLKYEISMFEGIRNRAYDDATGKSISFLNGELKGNVTIGIGFNMDSKTARQEWNRVFKGKINFDDARNGKVELNDVQIDKLYNISRELRCMELKKIYGSVWEKMRADDKLVTESV